MQGNNYGQQLGNPNGLGGAYGQIPQQQNNQYGQQPGGGLGPSSLQNPQFLLPNTQGQSNTPITNQILPGNQDNNNYHFRFKIALVGDSGVGKTTFLDAISSTLGSVVENEESSELHIKTTFYIDDAYQYKIVYFDMPGKERHHKYVHKYVNGSTAIIYLFDVTKRPTFERVEQWITECERACEIPIKILVGNKIDIIQPQPGLGGPQNQNKKAQQVINPVGKNEAIGLARKYGMEYFETCSIGEASIVQVFDHLFNSLLALIPNPPDPEQLLGKNVVLGSRVLNDIKFKLSLAELLPNYD